MQTRSAWLARAILAVVVGAALANLVIFGWEWVGPLTPFGARVDAAVAGEDWVARMPTALKLWVVGGWFAGATLGALAAFMIGRSDVTGFVVAGLLGAAGIANVLMIPHPLWMQLAAVAAPFAGAVVAFGAYRRWRAARLHLGRQ